MATLGVAAVAAGVAAADVVVPTPTVPNVTVPAVTVPQVKLPVSTPKVSTPHASTPGAPAAPSLPSTGTSAVSGTTSGVSSSAGSPVGSAASGGSGSTSTTSAAHRAPRATHLRVKRPYISLQGRRTTTITFRLASAGSVVLLVQELAPVCRVAARIHVAGQAGLNSITFGAHVGKQTLEPGTYRVVPRRHHRNARHGVTIVVVASGTPDAAAIASARAANACAPAATVGSSAYAPSQSSLAGGTGSGSANGGGTSAAGNANGAASGSGNGGGAPFKPRSNGGSGNGSGTGGTLHAAPYTNTSGTTPNWIKPLLLAGVALATLLLALAAMPEAVARASRFGEVVAHRRLSLALAGGATLVAFALAYVVAGA